MYNKTYNSCINIAVLIKYFKLKTSFICMKEQANYSFIYDETINIM